MSNLTIKNITLEPGRPKVVIPLTGTTQEEIIKECETIKELPCDMLEWRLDYFLEAKENLAEIIRSPKLFTEIIKILDYIDYMTGDMPLILTLRSAGEGGKVNISRTDAELIRSLIMESGLVDIIDIELFGEDGTLDEQHLRSVIDRIHQADMKVLLSYHDFDKMPKNTELLNLVDMMDNLGADICKVAAMCNSRDDAKVMLEVCDYIRANDFSPICMIGMGEDGKIVRVAGGKYGSCMTFAAGAMATAPGQVDAVTLKEMLDKFYGEEQEATGQEEQTATGEEEQEAAAQ